MHHNLPRTEIRKSKMKKIALYVLLTCLPLSISALERPNALEVKKVIDYYKKGKGQGVVLVESMLCEDVYRSGPKKHEAKNVLSSTSFKKGEKVFLWMNFMVPEKVRANIHFEYKRKGKVRKADDLTISTATRYRSWRRLPTSKAGTWEVSISQELEDTDIELSKITYTVY